MHVLVEFQIDLFLPSPPLSYYLSILDDNLMEAHRYDRFWLTEVMQVLRQGDGLINSALWKCKNRFWIGKVVFAWCWPLSTWNSNKSNMLQMFVVSYIIVSLLKHIAMVSFCLNIMFENISLKWKPVIYSQLGLKPLGFCPWLKTVVTHDHSFVDL